MKYLVVSDSHGDKAILQKLVTAYAGKVDLMLHCGDSELPVTDEVFKYFKVVRGNCDYDLDLQDEQFFDRGQDKILLVHGHLLGVGFGLGGLQAEMDELGANMAFFGHTHQLGVEVINGKLLLNPGSISYPRGKYTAIGGTFAIVETFADENAKQIEVQYYDRELNAIPELQVTFNGK